MSEFTFNKIAALGHDTSDLDVQRIARTAVNIDLQRLATASAGNMLAIEQRVSDVDRADTTLGRSVNERRPAMPSEWGSQSRVQAGAALDRELFLTLTEIAIGRLRIGLGVATQPRPLLRLFGLPTVGRVEPADARDTEFEVDADELLLRTPNDGDDLAVVLVDGTIIGIGVTSEDYFVTQAFPELPLTELVVPPLEQWRAALDADPWLQSRLTFGDFGPAAALTQWERAGEVLRFSVDRDTSVASPLDWSQQQDSEQHELIGRAIEGIATSLLCDMIECEHPDELDLLSFCETRETLESLRVMVPARADARAAVEEAIAEVDEQAETTMLAGRPLEAWHNETRWQRSVLSNWDGWWNGGWLPVPPESPDDAASELANALPNNE